MLSFARSANLKQMFLIFECLVCFALFWIYFFLVLLFVAQRGTAGANKGASVSFKRNKKKENIASNLFCDVHWRESKVFRIEDALHALSHWRGKNFMTNKENASQSRRQQRRILTGSAQASNTLTPVCALKWNRSNAHGSRLERRWADSLRHKTSADALISRI